MGNDVGELWIGWKIEYSRAEEERKAQVILGRLRDITNHNRAIDNYKLIVGDTERVKFMNGMGWDKVPIRLEADDEERVRILRIIQEGRDNMREYFSELKRHFVASDVIDGVTLYEPYETDEVLMGIKIDEAYNRVTVVPIPEFRTKMDEAVLKLSRFVMNRDWTEKYLKGDPSVLVVGRYD